MVSWLVGWLKGGLAAANAACRQAVGLHRGIVACLGMRHHNAEALNPFLGILAILGLEY